MRLTARRRAMIAIVLTWPLGYAYLIFAVHVALSLLRFYRTGYPYCGSNGALSTLDRFNGCDSSNFRSGYAWIELIGSTLAAAAIAYALGRWVLWPVRSMAQTVERLGPNSLGVRMSVGGPARDEVRQLGAAVDGLLDRVAEGYEGQRRFAANASHELRTPLATPRALIEVSLAATLTTDQLDLLSRQLLATNERNEKLIEGLLVLAETDRGLLVHAPQRLDLIAAAIVETLRPLADERGVTLRADLEPVEVPGEQPLLERLVSNLVQNAVKYNVAGGWVQVAVRADGRLLVGNSGPHVAPESVDGLFEAFRRGSGDRLDHGGGAGLGLTIARSVVAAHGGTIRAHAEPAGGLQVTVGLPTA